MGAITPVGNDVAATWHAITSGVSGGGLITKFDHTTFPVHFACEV
jgi:3-oxoacyl-[acyl-carrier-protein] synthase II